MAGPPSTSRVAIVSTYLPIGLDTAHKPQQLYCGHGKSRCPYTIVCEQGTRHSTRRRHPPYLGLRLALEATALDSVTAQPTNLPTGLATERHKKSMELIT